LRLSTLGAKPGTPVAAWRWAQAVLVVGALLAGCGGGSGDAAAPAPEEPFVWIDDGGIQAFGAASTVEMGFDGTSSYLRRDGRMITQAGIFKPDLAYIGFSGTPVAGQTTQWVRYVMRGDGYFTTQAQHLPIILRFAQYPDPRVTHQAPTAVEGKMVFFGRDGLRAWDCATPDAVGIYYETRVSGRNEVPDLGAVKCAQDQPGLRDGVWYQVEISAGMHGIAYTVTDEQGLPVATGSTDDRDYPSNDWNRAFLEQVVGSAPEEPFPQRYASMDSNHEFAFLSAFTNSGSAWSLTFKGIASGWR